MGKATNEGQKIKEEGRIRKDQGHSMWKEKEPCGGGVKKDKLVQK